MRVYTVYIAESHPEKEAMEWIWDTFARFAEITYNPAATETGADFVIDESDRSTIRYNKPFWDKLQAKRYAGKNHLDEAGFVLYENGEIDYFSTCFYFINCVWEYDTTKRDGLGRSDYGQSVWAEMGLDCTTNRVADMFRLLCGQLHIPVPRRRSRIFLSHDIDSIYNAWKEDGKSALKKGNIPAFISGALSHFTGRPAWYNIPEIIRLEKKWHAKSTFFWLTEKGRIDGRRTNADYDIENPKIQHLLRQVEENGFENGLHKSLATTSFSEEFAKLKTAHLYNRHHYLHFSIPDVFKTWLDAGLQVDCSLGYAEHYGFRNGYGLPFFPFDVVSRKTVPVLEIPLHIMDGTFSKYKNLSAEKAYVLITDFLYKNQNDAVLSVLWHNSHFTDYKYRGYPDLYGRILKWANERGMTYVSVGEIVDRYGISAIVP